jgi:hypothetical protein
MFQEALEHMRSNTLFALLDRLSHDGYLKKQVCPESLTSDDLEDIWEAYDRDPAEAVNLLEIVHGFLFEQEKVREFGLGTRDWNRVVAAAKDFLEEQDNEVDAAMERLEKTFSFLSPSDVRNAVEQAQKEMQGDCGCEQADPKTNY